MVCELCRRTNHTTFVGGNYDNTLKLWETNRESRFNLLHI